MRNRPRKLTAEEVRDQLLTRVWHVIRYWQRLEDPGGDRIEGAVFSVLAILDGTAVDLPGFVVAPAPHFSDKRAASNNDRTTSRRLPKSSVT